MNISSIQDQIYKDKNFVDWSKNWKKRISFNGGSQENSFKLMKQNNPIVIPRNHKVEEALEAAKNDDFKLLKEMLTIVTKPYFHRDGLENYQSPSQNTKYQTFCGT
jgi:uncharacterized protein YdiU (UPF0061 family)